MNCLYCGHGPLVPYLHWRVCPKCPHNKGIMESLTPAAPQLDPLMMKGRPTLNGKKV